jgi:hypothetical protein
MLKTKPIDEFDSLILRKRQNIHHFVDTIFSVNRPTQQMIDGIYIHLCECKDPHLKLGRIL